MDSESQSSADNNDEVSKLEHIKQRLKDMGVSDDSERPGKSLLSKYGKYMMAIVAFVLVVAYGVEYSNQQSTVDMAAADDSTVSEPVQSAYNGYAVSPYNQMTPPGYQAPPWMQPPASMQNKTDEETTTNSNNLNQNPVQHNNPYYARRYPIYPHPYRSNYQGRYPNAPVPMQRPVPRYGYGYGQAPGGYNNQNTQGAYQATTPPRYYPSPYNSQPYYNGWQRY